MRKYILPLLIAGCLFLTGCLETTEEINLNENGSGTMSTTSDMSAMIGLAKTMGGGADLEKASGKNMDSTILLTDRVDSISTLTKEEKDLVRDGTMKIKVNIKEEKMFTKISFPFSSPSQIEKLTRVTSKVTSQAMTAMMKEAPQGAAEQMPETSSFDDYYDLEFSNGELTRKVNKTK